MEIDWFTVGAQIVNFAILLGLLAKFLYRPILNAVESREQRIQQRIDDSQQAMREAEQRREEYRTKIEEFEAQRERAFRELQQEVEAKRADLLDGIRQDIQERRRRWIRRFQGEQQRFFQEYRDRLADELFAGLRQAAGDLADVRLEGQIVQKFVDELHKLDETTLDEMVESLETDADASGELSLTVETRWELASGLRDEIESAFSEVLERPVDVEFARENELLAGIEFNVAGHRFGWSLRSYLEGLRAELDSVVAEQMTQSEVQVEGAS